MKSYPRAKVIANDKETAIFFLVLFGVFEVLALVFSTDCYSSDNKMRMFIVFGYSQIGVALFLFLFALAIGGILKSNNDLLNVSPLTLDDDEATVVYLSVKKQAHIKRMEIVSVEASLEPIFSIGGNGKLGSEPSSCGVLTINLKNGKTIKAGILEGVVSVKNDMDSWLKGN